MPILVDFNQVFISNIMKQPNLHVYGLQEDLIRHMVLNSLRSYRTKFSNEYGELDLCFDNRRYWRKDAFEFYKANRKKSREESGADWSGIFQLMSTLKSELIKYFPYRVLEVEGAEADDLIGAICNHFGDGESILILSGDKDFLQLQKYSKVKQYNPVAKDYVITGDPSKTKKEHIMRGDRGDGIPNFLTKDNVFVNGGRQKPLSKLKLEQWSKLDPEDFCDYTMLYGYKRNQQLVDFDFIPINIQKEVINTYINYEFNDRSQLMGYFMENKLKDLMESISDF